LADSKAGLMAGKMVGQKAERRAGLWVERKADW
jgi:hypothetical protein